MKSNPYIQMLEPLIGGTITKIVYDESDPHGDPFCGFIVTRPEAVYQVIALRDPEGNGAGFVEVTKVRTWLKDTCDKCGGLIDGIDKFPAVGTMGVPICTDCDN